MAPAPEAYFPSLDKCFSGDAQLLSWKRAYLHLCDSETGSGNAAGLYQFLSHPESIRCLSQSLNPFAPPSAKSKAEFESKTAAIHVSTSPQAPYDLAEIKADALWLSQKAKIDEVTALRITILEWQSRPATRLLAGFSEEESTSLQDAAGVDGFRASLAGLPMVQIVKRTAGRDDGRSSFASEESRRQRLRLLYLSEKNHILRVSRKLLAVSLHGRRPNQPIAAAKEGSAKETAKDTNLRELGLSIFKDKSGDTDRNRFLGECVTAIRSRLSDFEGEGGWLGAAESDQDCEDAWRTMLIDEIVHIAQILFLQLQSSNTIPTADLLLSWLRLMVDYEFLESVRVPCEEPISVLLPLQAFVSLTTLAFLKLSVSIPFIIDHAQSQAGLSGESAYFLSREHISEINETFLNSASAGLMTASPAVFAWGLIMYTMREIALTTRERRELEQFHSAVDSFQSNTPAASPGRGSEQSLYEDLLDCARSPRYGDEAVTILTAGAIDRGRVFDAIIALATKVSSVSAVDDGLVDQWIREALLDLVRVSTEFLDYMPEIVESVLAILTGSPTNPPWISNSVQSHVSEPRSVFYEDPVLMDRIFRVAQSRFPYETVPFLKLCRALTSKELVVNDGLPAILSELETMNTFTQVVPQDFQGYETIREDENANFVSLVEPLPMIEPAQRKQRLIHNPENALIVTSSSQVPTSTTGQVVSEAGPPVIMWQHQYSCLSFIGSWLEERAENGGFPGQSEDSIAEAIGLLADLISSAGARPAQGAESSSAKRILEMASDGLARQGDIISVILDILEQDLQNISFKPGSQGPLESTIACLQFLRALVPILPSRVWPFLSRSSFLGSDGKGGVMTAVISAVEVTSGEYPFLLNCVRLLDAIVEDSASRSAIRRASHRGSSRLKDAMDWSAGVPAHTMSDVLLTFVRTMIDVYNSNANWRFNNPEDRLEVNTLLANTFEKILYYAYGAGDSMKLESKITNVFSTSAPYVLDVLRPSSKEELPFNPVLRIILDGLNTPTSTIYLRPLTVIERQLKSTLKLSIKLVQAAQLIGSPASLLEEQLFKAAPVLVKLYGLHDSYRLLVISLLDLLVSRAASDPDNEPPSLLGHLGAESTCLFLDMLAQFDQPLNDSSLFIAIWQLLSTFVSKRQQWLAVYLLTGSSPRESLKQKDGKGKAPAMRATPFFQIALDTLSKIEQVDPQIALSMLEFVSRSQEHWPWATPELKKHPNFFNGIIQYVAKLKLGSLPPHEQIFATRIAAVTADLCTVYLHSAKEARDMTFFKTLIPLITWFANNAVEVSGYNASLHANLRKNFEMKYAGCKLLDFKRTSLEPRLLGRDYYYDMNLGEKLLSYDFAWIGSRNQGFAEEFERANLNLSLVEAQVSLLHSWKFFAIEHCADFCPDKEVQKSMALVVKNCLVANTGSIPQEAVFDRLQQTRVDFAQALLQRLVQIQSKGAEVFGLLSVVWEAMRARGGTYENALANDDTEYYRSLLNVLFLSLQFHLNGPSRTEPEVVGKKPKFSSDTSIVLEVVKVVVAQGFRTLTTYLHDDPQKCHPRDFAILTAILQTCLQVKYADRLYGQIAFHIEDNDTARYALTLFSWSDQIAIEGDPIYGELSILFLLELSTVPMLAEHLAVEAVLMKLTTCRLTNVLQQSKGCGPFDPIPRLHSIWSGGILPLCINLLYHVMRAAPEVAAFLNQFGGQLNRASESFTSSHAGVSTTQPAGRICLSMASEAYSLALISFILERFREAGPSAGIDIQTIQELKWDKGRVKEDIEELLGRRQTLRARIVATSEKELELARQKPLNATASGAEDRLEEKIVNELSAALVCLGGEVE
ncbi:hypothetical protein DTO166G4_302 [Paecilomyces variotii]|nr:hypothetical protein DTO166G4_302 [Paecilomyces variotii]KAJ9241095.1 hypothetical protein DTO166G5_1257 [Paecilomyces variotii]